MSIVHAYIVSLTCREVLYRYGQTLGSKYRVIASAQQYSSLVPTWCLSLLLRI